MLKYADTAAKAFPNDKGIINLKKAAFGMGIFLGILHTTSVGPIKRAVHKTWTKATVVGCGNSLSNFLPTTLLVELILYQMIHRKNTLNASAGILKAIFQ